MYDPVLVSAKISALKVEQTRSTNQRLGAERKPRYWRNLARTAIVAFAAGWLAASIF